MRSLVVLMSSVLVGSLGCASVSLEPPPPPPFKVAISVEGDPGRPIGGALVTRNAKTVATTGSDGLAELTLDGADGETVDAAIRCPEGHTSPTKPISMRLARTRDGRAPVFKVTCPPTQRHVVVAIKAENGANLPVLYLGKVITRTDASGAAHFALEAAPGEQFQVTLDTSGKEGEKLKPPSPSKPFTVGGNDDVFVFDQRFDVEKKKVVSHKTKLPTCLGCKA
ncbi:MAG TPA: hypothetical protein VLT33_51360 [Labilithrix sp.]|nr:hypothetical protein [Labilithrix sp.]